jgi:hypothetical protein
VHLRAVLDLVSLGRDNRRRPMTAINVRDSVPEDIAYLLELRQQVQSADWWLEGWPREGDIAVIATNEAGDCIGAAWCRRETIRPGEIAVPHRQCIVTGCSLTRLLTSHAEHRQHAVRRGSR